MSLSEYLRFPDGFIFIAVRTISIKPPRSRCRRLHIKQQTRSNRTTSCCFEEISGFVLKCGKTRRTRSSNFRTSNLRVLSDRSGRIDPQSPAFISTRRSSARSAFGLTEKLGRTSHPNRCLRLGWNETQKQPSPSTDRKSKRLNSSHRT